MSHITPGQILPGLGYVGSIGHSLALALARSRRKGLHPVSAASWQLSATCRSRNPSLTVNLNERSEPADFSIGASAPDKAKGEIGSSLGGGGGGRKFSEALIWDTDTVT